MTMTFYYAPMSSSARVHWALEELGVSYEKKKLDLAGGDQKKPEYLALNPNGKVPLLVDDGLPIYESLAILLHLGERYGVDKGLFPAATMARAECFRWMCWGSVSVVECASRILRNTSERFPEAERNAAAAASARQEMQGYLAIVDQALEGKEYLMGGAFSFADLAIAAYMPFLARIGVDSNPFKNVVAWSGRCMQRPALARAMMG